MRSRYTHQEMVFSPEGREENRGRRRSDRPVELQVAEEQRSRKATEGSRQV